MKIRFLKKHDPYKKGDTENVGAQAGNYFIKHGVAEAVEDGETAQPQTTAKEKKTVMVAKEKKSNAGPNPIIKKAATKTAIKRK